ncbi:uncharacterized protein LOC128237744 [Mya arenaria]|uniref:uncharacterized protein LOC128237744 n=1 Tax=Mya arenaria TaxID=6604 RepID=UPI0022DFBDB2|nr:uncharacterized protein LOC128237744 [Mya arenaria]
MSSSGLAGPFGPPYPVTGAWFKDRYSYEEWNQTLHQFSLQGGDSVILRAPPVQLTTRQELVDNPNFKWCVKRHENGSSSHCVDDAFRELSDLDVNVVTLLTYQYEERFEAASMLACEQYDKMIVADRIYMRLVLPHNKTNKCDYRNTNVTVLFTSFAGTDPHELLLDAAHEYKMAVYFGVPGLPSSAMKTQKLSSQPIFTSYSLFLERVLESHSVKYSNRSLLKGYFLSDDFNMPMPSKGAHFDILKYTYQTVKKHNKQFGVDNVVNTNKLLGGNQLGDIINSFRAIATQSDVISVRDGRGSGLTALFWETQRSRDIQSVDPTLFNILQNKIPSLITNATTFQDVYNNSTSEVFDALAKERDDISKTSNSSFVLWLNIEAYDELHSDDLCLPVDRAGSGVGRMLNKITKPRVDHVLTHAGTAVQKIVSLAWDPSFTCTTKDHPYPLRSQIVSDMGRPIISRCFFHSSFNRSVVVIGYNLEGETQGFTVDWPNVNGHRVKNDRVYGYYFELDWGRQHGRIESLEYVQMYDPYDVISLAPKGYVNIKANNSYNGCSFVYDFTNKSDESLKNDSRKLRKNFVREKQKPVRRVEAQDTPFTSN